LSLDLYKYLQYLEDQIFLILNNAMTGYRTGNKINIINYIIIILQINSCLFIIIFFFFNRIYQIIKNTILSIHKHKKKKNTLSE